MILLTAQSAFATATNKKHEVIYFYENYCESCTPEEDFAENFQMLTGVSIETCDFSAYNVARSSGREALNAAKSRYGIEQILLPIAIIDGTVYAGSQALNETLPEVSLTWAETTDSVILYLYVPACESCARAASILEELPHSVIVKRGELEFESIVRIEKIDASTDPANADALFDAYGVPEEKRIAPCMFFSDRYLSGIESIERDLLTMVRIGRASGGLLQIEANSNGTPTE